MNKIFISGASGLVGGNCMHYFKEKGIETLGTYFSYPAKGTQFYDTLNPENSQNVNVDAFQPEVILHCGALTHVDLCEDEQEKSYQQTVTSTKNMLEITHRFNAKFVFISTDYIFDGKEGPYTEKEKASPLSVYGKHKWEAEQMVAKYPNHLILRITNVYGDEERGKNFISRIIQQILDGKKLTLKLPSDQYATPINAHDIARSLYLLLKNNKTGVYNIASTDYMSRVQLSLTILKYFPHAEYALEAIPTHELGQKADRPLQGGLKNHKFMDEFPDFRFSTVDDYVKKFVEK